MDTDTFTDQLLVRNLRHLASSTRLHVVVKAWTITKKVATLMIWRWKMVKIAVKTRR